MNCKNICFTKEYIDGKELMKNSFVSICSIVRDCQTNLKKNIPRVERLRGLFKNSEVIIFENESKDNTLKILKNWERESNNVYVLSDNFEDPTIQSHWIRKKGPNFSISSIGKMAFYRNKYMNFLNSHVNQRDFVIVTDLDISNFCIDGIIHSFGTSIDWDCISANGVSLSSSLIRQYHDSYALIEYGKLNDKQTKQSIKVNRARFSFLKPGMPLVLVDSAYGGLAIYKWESIKDAYYSCPINNDLGVQCKCEHVGLHMRMKEKGHTKIFVNPNMMVKYRSITIKFLYIKLKERFLEIVSSKNFRD
jgi:hypothetical protein